MYLLNPDPDCLIGILNVKEKKVLELNIKNGNWVRMPLKETQGLDVSGGHDKIRLPESGGQLDLMCLQDKHIQIMVT